MGPLRSQSSSHSLRSVESSSSVTSSSSARQMDRFTVPAIPRWEELRGVAASASSSASSPAAHPQALQPSFYTPPSNLQSGMGPDLSTPEALFEHHLRQTSELEALRRQQQMAYELERTRLRERALRGEQTQEDSSSRSGAETAPTTSSSSSASRQPTRKIPQHKVYLINCKHCDLFLTDRGMKAVLLLKPNITLYSTDAVPANCSPLYPQSSFLGGFAQAEPPVERTCDCLTQTLGCHGCGAAIGYNIVAPCARCTSSVAKHQRGSNGHRTVLHCSEIRVRERRFVPGEPGVRAAPLPVDLWRLLEAESILETQAAAYSSPASQCHSPSSDATACEYGAPALDADSHSEKAAFAAAVCRSPFDDQRRIIAMQKDAMRSRLLNPAKDGRIILRGEPIFWSDLVAGGERAEPFDADLMLDLPLAGR